MRILITGGAGFIGSHAARAFRDAGHGVCVLDDFSTGHRANLPTEVAVIEGDVADAAQVAGAVAKADAVVHLAAIASVQRGVEDWLGTHRVNLGGTIAVLDAARARNVPVVYASSAAVYGDCRALPIAEDAPRVPLSAYGADKLGSEQHAAVAAHVFGVPSYGLRFFNVYGPRQDPRSPYSGVISIFCERIRRGEPVTVFGDGLQTRDFVYVADVVAAITQALGALVREPAGAHVSNVCTGQGTDLLTLAEAIGQATGHAPVIAHAAPREGEVRNSVGAPGRLAEALGVLAQTPLARGLGETLAWMAGAG